MPFDLVIRGGTVVLPQTDGVAADIAISGEKIAAVLSPGTAVDGAKTLDAAGKLVLPGVIDVHLHLGHGKDIARPRVADGPFWSWHRVPAGGTRFNFLTQAGTGFLFPAGRGWSVLAGYRWVHISNADLGELNPSWNYHTLILGLRHEKFPGKETSAGKR